MPITKKTISLEEADAVINGIIEKVLEDGLSPVVVSVYGIDKASVSSKSMDGVMPISVSLADNKAYTSIMTMRRTMDLHMRNHPEIITDVYTEEWHKNNLPVDIRNYADARITLFPGGVPLNYKGQIVGSIGVSGIDGGTVDDMLAMHGSQVFKEQFS